VHGISSAVILLLLSGLRLPFGTKKAAPFFRGTASFGTDRRTGASAGQ